MQAIRNALIACALAFSGAALIIPTSSFAADKAEPAKCDKDGKSCKEGDNCKAENCKKAEPKKEEKK